MSKFVNRSKAFFKKNGPTILTVVGGVGVIATAVLAVKATPKALERVEAAKNEKGEDLTKFEAIVVAGPSYIPAVAAGAATLICIFSANALSKRQQASIVSAYALLDSSYKQYKHKVEELYGTTGAERIAGEIAKDNYEDDIVAEDGKQLFFDSFSNRYFESTMEDVLRAEYNLNRDLTLEDHATLNRFYEHLGLEPIEAGDALGWSVGANFALYWQSWVDFSHQKTAIDDDLECYIIHIMHEPILEFEDYW